MENLLQSVELNKYIFVYQSTNLKAKYSGDNLILLVDNKMSSISQFKILKFYHFGARILYNE